MNIIKINDSYYLHNGLLTEMFKLSEDNIKNLDLNDNGFTEVCLINKDKFDYYRKLEISYLKENYQYPIGAILIEKTNYNEKALDCLFDVFNTFEGNVEFLTIEQWLNNDYYTDCYEYEAYISDGNKFVGINVRLMDDEELQHFIDKHKDKFEGEVKIMFVDYPECK